MSDQRKGRRVGKPLLRRKSNRQCIRLTRNGFSIRQGRRVYLAKIGDVRVHWSRPLPSVPSSVTVIREPDGRYYLSFVVEREAQTLPVIEHETGIDLGLDRLGASAGPRVPLRSSPRPGRQRRSEHPRGRADREAKRFWSACKSCYAGGGVMKEESPSFRAGSVKTAETCSTYSANDQDGEA